MATVSFDPLSRVEGQNFTQENMLSDLMKFISKRVFTVSWEHPHPDSNMRHEDTYLPQKTLFFRSLRNNYSQQAVCDELRRIITDKDSWKGWLDRNPSKPFIPCYAAFVIKELGELDTLLRPEDVQDLLSNVLEALEDSYEVYCPAKDEGLTYHFNAIRRETVSGLGEIIKVCSSEYLHPIVDFLARTYKNLEQGKGLKRNLRFNGEIWGMKTAIISILAEAAEKASHEDIESISYILINAVRENNRNELLILPAIGKLAKAVPLKISPILIVLIKITQEEGEFQSFSDLFYNPESSLGNIIRNIPTEQKDNILTALNMIANDQGNPDSPYAAEAIRRLNETTS